MTYSSEVMTVSWFQLSTNIAFKKTPKMRLDANLASSNCKHSKVILESLCNSFRCFVLTSPDKNIGKRHRSAFPSVARLRAFSQAAERPGNFLETWVDSQHSTPFSLFFLVCLGSPLDPHIKSISTLAAVTSKRCILCEILPATCFLWWFQDLKFVATAACKFLTSWCVNFSRKQSIFWSKNLVV